MPYTGLLLGPLENLRDLIADATAWRTWTDSANAAEARAHTHLILPKPQTGDAYTVDERSSQRPLAVVSFFTPESGFGGEPQQSRTVAGLAYRHANKLFLKIEADTPADKRETYEEGLLWFMGQMDSVYEQILGLGNTPGYLAIAAMSVWIQPFRVSSEKRATLGDYWTITFVIDVGLG